MVVLLLLSLAAADGEQVFVERTTLSSTVAAMLAEELGEERVVASSTVATHVARVEPQGDTLLITVRARDQLVLARTIAVDVLPASLRVAVLLVARTVRLGPPPTLTTTAPARAPPPPTAGRLTIAPQALLAWWARPSVTPQVGLLVSAAYADGWLGVQLTGAIAGGLCCSRSTSDVDATALELHAALEAKGRVFELGGWGLALLVGTGVSGYFVDAAPVFVDSPSPGTRRTVRDAQLSLLGGAEITYPLSARLAALARLTVRWAPVDREVVAPAALGGEGVVTGRVAPWFSAGVAWDAL